MGCLGRGDDVLVGALVISDARAAEADAHESVGRLVHRREPRGDLVERREDVRVDRVDLAVLKAHADVRVGRAAVEELGIILQREEVALVVVEVGALRKFPLVVQDREADRELVGQEDLVVVQAVAERAKAAELVLQLSGVLRQAGVADGRVDDAGGAAQTEQNCIRPALDVDAVRVVAVPRHVGQEEVPGVVGGGQAADAGVGLRGLLRALGVHHGSVAGAGEVTALSANLCVGRVHQQLLAAVRVGVFQEFLGDDRDRVANVFQVRLDARSGQRAGGGVSSVLVCLDHEGREHQDLLIRRSSGGCNRDRSVVILTGRCGRSRSCLLRKAMALHECNAKG